MKVVRSPREGGSQCLRRVYLENETYDTLLTEAMDKPELFRGDVACLEVNHQFLLHPQSTLETVAGQSVLVFVQVLDKTKVAKILILLFVVSPAVGAFVGIGSRRPNVGIAASAGVVALTALLQGLAAWFQN